MSTRREAFYTGLVLSEAVLLAACSNNAPSQEDKAATEPIPEPSTWTVIELPNGDFSIGIDHVSFQQRPEIGLKGLIIVGQRGVPAVGIGTFWSTSELAKTNRQKFGGMFGIAKSGFQEVGEKFVPDPSKAASLNTNNISKAVAERFSQVVAHNISEEADKRPDEFTVIAVVPRPTVGKEYAIVFDNGFIPYNGQRSPRSFLSIKFKFTNAIPDTAPNPNPGIVPTPRVSGSVA